MTKEKDRRIQGQRNSCPEAPGWERRCFYGILGVSFVMIFALNLLTPLLSDDYSYLYEVEQADSILDLAAQEFHQYLTWNGRSVAHFILRVFLYLPQIVFKIANSLAFVTTAVLMTRLVSEERRYDCFTLLMTELALWLFSVDPSETILWEDGACNYLWGAMIILTFMLAVKRSYEKRAEGILPAAGLLALGLLAGWCNENTSGGCLLFVLALLIGGIRSGDGVRVPILAGAAGNLAGLLLMVLSPGERLRASYETDESYSGLLGLLSRFQKITLNVREYFGVLLAILLICFVILALQHNYAAWKQVLLYTFLFCATAYALILSRPTQPRALFGAGLFLDIAVITAVRSAVEHEKLHPESGTGIVLRSAAFGGCAVLTLSLFFEYADNATNVARIRRDERTRIAAIQEQAAAGAEEIIVPLVHTDFYNDYSAIAKMEMTDDPEYWINVIYETYYGVESITAIDYDEWEELMGIE